MSSSKRTFGSMPKTVPPGYFKAVRFPILALMNKETGDHRLLSADGGSTRDLPVSIRNQVASTWGHEGSVPTGALFEVTFDPDFSAEFGVVSGAGFLLDDDNGRQHFRYIATGAQRGNSIDLADSSAKYVEDAETGRGWIEFTKWAIAATTGVGTPAFAEAHAEVDWTPDELTAAIGDPMDELVASITPEEWLKTGKIIVLPTKSEARDVDNELLAAYSASDPIPARAVLPRGARRPHQGRRHRRPPRLRPRHRLGAHPRLAARRPASALPRDGYASFQQARRAHRQGHRAHRPDHGVRRPPQGQRPRDDLVDAYGGIENCLG
jgi:hypothetical protein